MPGRRKTRSQRKALVAGFTSALLGAAVSAPARAESPDEAAVEKEQRCLALAIYFEARSEGPEGMRAVASVVLNRVESDEFPSTPCEVVHEGGETPPCQFSWWCDGKSDVPRDEEQWKLALSIARSMLEDRGDDPTRGALFFHSAQIPVPWRVERTRTEQVLGHIYYR